MNGDLPASLLSQLDGSAGNATAGGQGAQAQQQQQQQRQQQQQLLIASLLTAPARERLARIHLVKPEKANHVEQVCLYHMKMGRFSAAPGPNAKKIDEQVLIQILDSLDAEEHQERTAAGGDQVDKIIIARRKQLPDDEDDQELDLEQFNDL